MALRQTLLQTRRPVLQKVWDRVPPEYREAVHRSLELLLDAAEQVLHEERGLQQRAKEKP